MIGYAERKRRQARERRQGIEAAILTACLGGAVYLLLMAAMVIG